MLGDIFREEREKKHLSLKDVETETNIRTLYLEAIEKEDYTVIRGEVYLKGFIKTYAKFLGLDPEEILNKYYEEKGISPQHSQENVSIPQETAADIGNADYNNPSPQSEVKKDNTFEQRIEIKKRKNKNLGNIIFTSIIFVVVVGCLAYFIVPMLTTHKTATAPVKQVQQTDNTVPAAPVPAKVDGVHISAVFNNSCWVQVKADDKTIFEKTVHTGDSFKWDGQKKIEMILGNAGAVKISLNGKDVGKPGNNGAVVKKRFLQDKVEDIKK
ncbi:helix-turn-helix domain-containing protein [Pectinatus sottacetonis]|uniref:helix-turn-helix domain-containing protein n=1 Tax=Pectinatus sottacetonis TaxID=1002795 RepID=UPI0018C74A03|nr:RodZ domain-containing protein [Pectinatus sottacetonis]